MILGMGVDIAEIERIKNSIEKFGQNFIDRIYTKNEQNEAANRKDFATYYAGRWAVKEAISKALGCGIGLNCSWLDIEILNHSSGRPQAKLQGQALITFQTLKSTYLHISLSHEGKNAVAMAVIE